MEVNWGQIIVQFLLIKKFISFTYKKIIVQFLEQQVLNWHNWYFKKEIGIWNIIQDHFYWGGEKSDYFHLQRVIILRDIIIQQPR